MPAWWNTPAAAKSHQRDLGGNVRTEVARVDISGELCSGRLATLIAGQRMELNLKDAGLDRGDVGDLVAQWVRVVAGEASAATLALLRLDHSSLVDVFGASKVTPSSLVTRLATTLSSGRLLLGLRLPPGRVAGRRLARCSGRLRLATLQSLDLGTLPLNDLPKLGNLCQERLNRHARRARIRRGIHARAIGPNRSDLARYPRERILTEP